jgi:hypothetical protein
MSQIDHKLCRNLNQLKHLKFELINNNYVVTLLDSSMYAIARGYGSTTIGAIKDLHSALI